MGERRCEHQSVFGQCLSNHFRQLTMLLYESAVKSLKCEGFVGLTLEGSQLSKSRRNMVSHSVGPTHMDEQRLRVLRTLFLRFRFLGLKGSWEARECLVPAENPARLMEQVF